jgi:hypothetical protein
MAGDTMFVSMAPELARALHNILGKALDGYARDYGALRLPAATNVKVTEQLDTASKQALDMAETVPSESAQSGDAKPVRKIVSIPEE